MSSRVPWATLALLHRGGWEPFPLPARAKTPPPRGVTGTSGQPLTVRTLERVWRAGQFHNVGTRVPAGVVGVDVDAHDTRRSLHAWQQLEQLAPDTWCVRNRTDDSVSGTRFYRAELPAGWVWAGSVGAVDTLHTGHRYQVLPPSIHPADAGGDRVYFLTCPEGRIVTTPHALPAVGELPHLSAEAVALLVRRAGAPLADTPRQRLPVELLNARTSDWCAYVATIYNALDLSGTTARHDAFNSRAVSLWSAHAQGHRGALDALDQLARLWHELMGPVRGERVAAGEWERMTTSAELRYGQSAWHGQCDCDRRAWRATRART